MLLGTALTSLLPFRLVPGVAAWMALALAGLSMYRAAGVFVPSRLRLTAALLYMFNPYLLLTVVVRYAMAEAWVQAFLPLTFLYTYLAATPRNPRDVLWSAVLLGCGWLTNIPEAVGLFYGFLVLAAALAIQARSLRPLITVSIAQSLGIVLAALRLVPALYEKSSVMSQNLLLYDYRSYMQLRRIPPPHFLVYLCGAYIALSLIFSVPTLRHIVRTQGRWQSPTLAFATLGAFAVLLQLPVSTLLWQNLPELRFVLFPFRLLPLLALPVALLISGSGVRHRLRRLAIIGLALCALTPFMAYHRLFSYQRFPSIALAQEQWAKGYPGVREYVPAGVPASEGTPDRERQLSAEGAFHDRSCSPSMLKLLPNERVVHTQSRTPCELVLNTYDYPFWHGRLDAVTALALTRTPGGLLSAAIPPGEHRVSCEFLPHTRLRSFSLALSGFALAAVLFGLGSGWRGRAPLPLLP